jgi:hypothetical protein
MEYFIFSIGAIIILSLIIVLFIYLNSIYRKNKESRERIIANDLHTRYLELMAKKQADSPKSEGKKISKEAGEKFSSMLPIKQNQSSLPVQEIKQNKITLVQEENKKPEEKNKKNKIRKIIESRRKTNEENNQKTQEDIKKQERIEVKPKQDIKKLDDKKNTKTENIEAEPEKKEIMQAIDEIKAKNQVQNNINVEPKDFIIDFLRNQSESLKDKIKELRKKGKDVEILDLELISATSKIDFLNVEFSLKFFRNILNSFEKIKNELNNYES